MLLLVWHEGEHYLVLVIHCQIIMCGGFIKALIYGLVILQNISLRIEMSKFRSQNSLIHRHRRGRYTSVPRFKCAFHSSEPGHIVIVRKLHNLTITFCYPFCSVVQINCRAVQLNKIDDTANCRCKA